MKTNKINDENIRTTHLIDNSTQLKNT